MIWYRSLEECLRSRSGTIASESSFLFAIGWVQTSLLYGPRQSSGICFYAASVEGRRACRADR